MNSKISVLVFLVVISWCFHENNGYKILGVFPVFPPSHTILGRALMKGFAEAGHDVTMVTLYKDKKPSDTANYREIIIEELVEEQKADFEKVSGISNPILQYIYTIPIATTWSFAVSGTKLSEKCLSNPKMQELIKSNKKFDIVVVPQFNSDSIKALAPHFGAHLVLLQNNAYNTWSNHLVGNPSMPSFTSDIFIEYVGKMSFMERVINTLMLSTQYTLWNAFNYPLQREHVRKYISQDLDLDKILYNVSMILSNSHISVNKPEASVPCMKQIGGYHVKSPKPLPEDLQKYLDEAKDGAIYFSLGTYVKAADMRPEVIQAFLNVFSKRKERILWKFEKDDLPGRPSNVLISKWLPQMDILAHPNIKVFITQGGFLSTLETIYNGVPVITIPVLGDQRHNARTAESFGYAVVIDYHSLNEELISAALEEITSNATYRQNAQTRSRLFHDRPRKPMEEAVYWIEYLVRNNAGAHWRVDYIDLAWYQWYLLDVWSFILAIVILVLYVIKKSISSLLNKCFSTNKQENKPQKDKKKLKKQ